VKAGPPVLEAGGKAAGEPNHAVGRAQLQSANVGSDAATVGADDNQVPFIVCKLEQPWISRAFKRRDESDS
jgi:hypothetical protein